MEIVEIMKHVPKLVYIDSKFNFLFPQKKNEFDENAYKKLLDVILVNEHEQYRRCKFNVQTTISNRVRYYSKYMCIGIFNIILLKIFAAASSLCLISTARYLQGSSVGNLSKSNSQQILFSDWNRICRIWMGFQCKLSLLHAFAQLWIVNSIKFDSNQNKYNRYADIDKNTRVEWA